MHGYSDVSQCNGCDDCPEETLRDNRLNEYDACEIIRDLVNAAEGRHVTLRPATETFLNLWLTGGDEVWHSDFACFIWEKVCKEYATSIREAYRVCDTIRVGEYRSFTVSRESFENFQQQYRKYNMTVMLENTVFYPLCDAVDNMSGSVSRDLLKEEQEYIVKIPETVTVEKNADFDEVWAQRKADIEECHALAEIYPGWLGAIRKIYPGWKQEFS